MFAGEHINTSEDRAVLHTALRLPRDAELVVDGQNAVADVHAVLDAMGDFTDRLRSGAWTGATGKRIETVVNIGIGGSGPRPGDGVPGLRHYADAGIAARFVSNVDPPTWLPNSTDSILRQRFSSSPQDVHHPGDADQRHRGAPVAHRRYWATTRWPNTSSRCRQPETGRGVRYRQREHVRVLGLGRRPLLGGLRDRTCIDGRHRPRGLRRFLSGFHIVDRHFATAPLEANAPALLGLIGLWYSDFFGAETRAVLPYSTTWRGSRPICSS